MAIRDLPVLNACLNALAACLLLVGLKLIKERRKAAHLRVMVSALAVSTIFLVSYLIYHFEIGSKRFEGPGVARTVYLAILLTHTILAVVNLPLIAMTLYRAYRERFPQHRRIAKWTWASWMYVSVTGVIIYLMNYQIWPGRSVAEVAFDQAKAAHLASNDQEALRLYRKAAGAGHVGANCFAAVIEDRINETDAASTTFSRFPEDAHCLALHAQSLVMVGQNADARPFIDKALLIAPNDSFVHAIAGFLYFREQKYAEAAKAFERSVALEPRATANVFNAGYAHYLYGDYAAARPLIMRALDEKDLPSDLRDRAKETVSIIDGSTWLCPMHPQVAGKPGDKCSECGMKLEPVSKGVPQ